MNRLQVIAGLAVAFVICWLFTLAMWIRSVLVNDLSSMLLSVALMAVFTFSLNLLVIVSRKEVDRG